jgi:signal transduction histidine kinase
MTRWRALLLVTIVALTGALGTLAVGSAMGMKGGELHHLLFFLIPGVVATVVAAAVAQPLLARSSIWWRLIAIAATAVVVSLANLAVLTRLMFVEPHDAAQVRVLLLYSMGTGVGVALALARSSQAALRRVVATARRLGEGDLAARVGSLRAEPELELMAATLDDMAGKLERSLEKERAIEAMRRDLFTAVSHDLRTPLSSLKAMLEAIGDNVVEDVEGIRRYTAHMRGAVDSLVALVDDLFELVQVEAGALAADPMKSSLAEVVRSALKSCEIQALEKGTKIEVDVRGAEQTLCASRLVRVFQNLLQNAIAHTPAAGTVRLWGRASDGRLFVSVSDTGAGLDGRHLQRVFEPFYRADPARQGSGSGLGLALAKKIVESLGGSIAVESQLGRGTTFRMSLPSAPTTTLPDLPEPDLRHPLKGAHPYN